MKKILCILLSSLFLLSAMQVAALAAETNAEPNVVTLAADSPDAKGYDYYLPNGYYVGLTWTDDDGKPIKAPKGGKLEWRWQSLGGKISVEQNASKPNHCTVTGLSGGWCRLEARRLDAEGNETGSYVLLIQVGYTGIGLLLDTISGGLYDSLRMDFYGIFFSLKILPYHYK